VTRVQLEAEVVAYRSDERRGHTQEFMPTGRRRFLVDGQVVDKASFLAALAAVDREACDLAEHQNEPWFIRCADGWYRRERLGLVHVGMPAEWRTRLRVFHDDVDITSECRAADDRQGWALLLPRPCKPSTDVRGVLQHEIVVGRIEIRVAG
jgi:hypothetical protein